MSQLFDRFEVNRAPRWPLMSRLVALSVVVHGVFLVAVVYVPTLRGMLFVASALSGIEFVNKDYDPTLLGQRATIINVGGPHEKLFYPPDYFGAPQVAETTQFDPMMVQPAPLPTPPPPVYRPRRVRTPKPAPLPTPAPEVASATPTPEPSPTPVSDEERKKAEAQMEEVEKTTGVKRLHINAKPWVDLATEGKQLFDDGKLNLNTAVDVSATAERAENGKLTAVNLTWNKPPTDATTAELANKVITAVSESEMLVTLEGAKAVQMSLKLDEKDVAIVIANEFPSAADAEKFANGYAALLLGARIVRSGTEDAELYKNVKVSQDDRQLVITFKMPKDAAGKMLADILAKKAAKDAAAAAAQNKS